MAHEAPPPPGSAGLEAVAQAIVSCDRCTRLRTYCARIAREKRAAYREDTYWGRPVPGFGDPHARIVLVGLAPAAHGANRTGRIFTGDGNGGSGDFLMTALYAAGLANQPFSRTMGDGLELHDVWMAASVRCAPPDNKPTPGEIAACYPHLMAELDALPRAQVLVALGGLAFNTCWRVLGDLGRPRQKKPRFEHGGVFRQRNGLSVVMSYHPSRQNTHTGRLTPEMLRQARVTARSLVR
jgi:uracil-DNA glycosylase family 4